MRRELASLAGMFWRGASMRRPDVIVSGTSPPCLLVVAQGLAIRHRARSVHWCMDLYPDIAVALGEVRKVTLFRIIDSVMGWCYRRVTRVVALDADMAALIKRHGVDSEIVRPWVITPMPHTIAANDPPAHATECDWMYSGNLGRAHEWETLLDAQALLEQRGSNHRLVFQGGGPSWPKARERAELLGLQRVEWRGYAQEDRLVESLLEAQCLVVTERPEVKGMLWPSKLALMLALPRPILYVGPRDSAIASQLGRLQHAGVFEPGDAAGVAGWLMRRQTFPNVQPGEVLNPHLHRSESIDAMVHGIEDAANVKQSSP